MKLKDAVTPGLNWQVTYPVVEDAVKIVLQGYGGDGMTAKELLDACGLTREPKAHRARFFTALKALRKHGLADWFDAYDVRSPYNKDGTIQQFVYLPPSKELQVARLEVRISELTKELTEAKEALNNIETGK